MAFELEALVGHLYVMGGRTIKTTPPGALVEVAPRKAARGREADTFFVLVLPSGTVAPNTFYEQMAQMSAERYFAAGGSVTAALREMLNTLNNNLFEHNQSGRTHYEANLICAVLRSDEVYVARVGAAAAVLRYSGQTFTYPEDLTVDETLYQPPLGVQPIPNVPMKRYAVDSGTRLLLADASIAEIKLDTLSHALTGSDLAHVLDDLKLAVLAQLQMMAVEFVPPDVPVPVPVVAGESSARIAVEIAATRAQSSQTQTGEAARVPPPARPTPPPRLRQALGQAAKTTGDSLLAVGEVIGKLLARPLDKNQNPISRRFLMGAVIGLPALIALVVAVSWALRVGETQFESCVTQTIDSANFARSLDSSNPASVIAAWEGTLTKVNECMLMRPDDPVLLGLQGEGRTILDQVNNIRRRDTALLATFPDARITSLVLQGLDMYALDSANNLVYRLQIGADGLSTATLPQPITSMRRGATVDGLTVGEVIDIAYDDLEDAITALDRGGVLVRCLPRFIAECDAQRVLAAETWQNPTRITIWQGRLYVLDPVGNQLWRYQATGGTYTGSPTEYFAGQVRPNLLNAVDFDITTTGIGTVYVLYSDGLMTSHVSGEAQPFAFADFPEGQSLLEVGAQSMYLNDTPVNPALYIVSQPTRTVYETTLAGTFMARYRVFNEDDFALVSDVVIEPSQRILYAASGNAIFALKMDQ